MGHDQGPHDHYEATPWVISPNYCLRPLNVTIDHLIDPMS